MYALVQSGRGGVSLDTERWAGGAVSRLTLAALGARDAGRYTCSAAGAADHVQLRVGDHYGDHEYNDHDYGDRGERWDDTAPVARYSLAQ